MQNDLEILFTRLQDAKLQVEFANTYVKEVQLDMELGTVAAADVRAAHDRALETQRLAVEQYMVALQSLCHANLHTDRNEGA